MEDKTNVGARALQKRRDKESLQWMRRSSERKNLPMEKIKNIAKRENEEEERRAGRLRVGERDKENCRKQS